MKNIDKTISRRKVIDFGVRTVVGAGLLGRLEPLTAGVAKAWPPSGNRALVCIYLIGGAGDAHLVERSATAPEGWQLHPSATELRELRRAGVLRVLTHENAPVPGDKADSTPGETMMQRYSGLRFLPGGFATPEWAARIGSVQRFNGDGALTFKGGLSLVAPGATLPSGDQFENAEIRQAMDTLPPLRTAFPASALGRQLHDVTRLLRLTEKLGLNQPVFLCTAGGFSHGAVRAGILDARYRELSQAVASFHAATVEMGIEQRVTTYTDAEVWPVRNDRISARLVTGGAALNVDLSQRLTADVPHRTLAAWLGHEA